jgi:hypothetical protein
VQDFSIDQVELQKRIDERDARIEADALAQKEQRRADRKAGLLTEGVVNGLRACTIPQLIGRRSYATNSFGIRGTLHRRRIVENRLCSQSCYQSVSAINVINLKLFGIRGGQRRAKSMGLTGIGTGGTGKLFSESGREEKFPAASSKGEEQAERVLIEPLCRAHPRRNSGKASTATVTTFAPLV